MKYSGKTEFLIQKDLHCFQLSTFIAVNIRQILYKSAFYLNQQISNQKVRTKKETHSNFIVRKFRSVKQKVNYFLSKPKKNIL